MVINPNADINIHTMLDAGASDVITHRLSVFKTFQIEAEPVNYG